MTGGASTPNAHESLPKHLGDGLSKQHTDTCVIRAGALPNCPSIVAGPPLPTIARSAVSGRAILTAGPGVSRSPAGAVALVPVRRTASIFRAPSFTASVRLPRTALIELNTTSLSEAGADVVEHRRCHSHYEHVFGRHRLTLDGVDKAPCVGRRISASVRRLSARARRLCRAEPRRRRPPVPAGRAVPGVARGLA